MDPAPGSRGGNARVTFGEFMVSARRVGGVSETLAARVCLEAGRVAH